MKSQGKVMILQLGELFLGHVNDDCNGHCDIPTLPIASARHCPGLFKDLSSEIRGAGMRFQIQ
eukprot:11534991-Prorocentrum_lima.AAC.1